MLQLFFFSSLLFAWISLFTADEFIHARHKKIDSLKALEVQIDCDAFLAPILEKRNACGKQSVDVVDICVYFASDYNYIVPFLVHHLTLGVNRIHIYNNDERVPWYNHPAVMCMISEQLVVVQPWWGENVLIKGLNHCFFNSITDLAKRDGLELTRVWGAVFDIDEMLVLHKDFCINTFVENTAGKEKKAEGVALNWAFFTPEVSSQYPALSHFGRTGNPAFLNSDGKVVPHSRNHHGGRSAHNHSLPLLPHEMLTRRMFEKNEIKTISRIGCSKRWSNSEHCPGYNECGWGHGELLDPEQRYIPCAAWTPWVDNKYPVAQLNHYWSLSLSDYLRKIHRGKGGSYPKNTDQFRNTNEFFDHGSRKEGMVNDTSFLTYYGGFFDKMKTACPKCFDVSYHFLDSNS